MWKQVLETLLLIFLGMETRRDIRNHQVSVPAAGIVFLAASGIRLIGEFLADGAAALLPELGRLCLGMGPGLFLLAAAGATGEAVGCGDALVLLVCGACVGFCDAAALLLTGLFLMTPVSLAFLVSGKGNRKTELPFLPFLLAAGILRLMVQG